MRLVSPDAKACPICHQGPLCKGSLKSSKVRLKGRLASITAGKCHTSWKQRFLQLAVNGALAVLRAEHAADVAGDALQEAHSPAGAGVRHSLLSLLAGALPAPLQRVPALAQTCKPFISATPLMTSFRKIVTCSAAFASGQASGCSPHGAQSKEAILLPHIPGSKSQ